MPKGSPYTTRCQLSTPSSKVCACLGSAGRAPLWSASTGAKAAGPHMEYPENLGTTQEGPALTLLSASDTAQLSTPTDTRTARFPPQLLLLLPWRHLFPSSNAAASFREFQHVSREPSHRHLLAPVLSAPRCPPARTACFQHWALKTTQAGRQLEGYSLGENPLAAGKGSESGAFLPGGVPAFPAEQVGRACSFAVHQRDGLGLGAGKAARQARVMGAVGAVPQKQTSQGSPEMHKLIPKLHVWGRPWGEG